MTPAVHWMILAPPVKVPKPETETETFCRFLRLVLGDAVMLPRVVFATGALAAAGAGVAASALPMKPPRAVARTRPAAAIVRLVFISLTPWILDGMSRETWVRCGLDRRQGHVRGGASARPD